MKAYSIDLRERIAAACAEPGATQTAVAARLCGSVSFVEKLRQRQRASGPAPLPDAAAPPLPLRGGPAPCLDASSRADLVACLRQQPDCHPERVTGVGGRAGRPRRESGHDGPGRASRGLAAFVKALQTQDFTCFKFVDETSTNPTHGRPAPAPKAGNGPTRPRPCTAGRTRR